MVTIPVIKYFFSPINLQNGRLQILYLLEIADFSHGIEFIFKVVIGQFNLRTIFLLSLGKTMNGYPKREKKSGLRTKIKSFHSGYSD